MKRDGNQAACRALLPSRHRRDTSLEEGGCGVPRLRGQGLEVPSSRMIEKYYGLGEANVGLGEANVGLGEANVVHS